MRNRRIILIAYACAAVLLWVSLQALLLQNPRLLGQPPAAPAEETTHKERAHLAMALLSAVSAPFCVTWDVNTDDWWTHHPQWTVSLQNDTHTCFDRIRDTRKARLFQRLYDLNYNGTCSNTTTYRMWNSGYSADLRNVVDGLVHTHDIGTPLQALNEHGRPWHYAKSVCPQQDMFCYFLPFSPCKPTTENVTSGWNADPYTQPNSEKFRLFYEYAVRPRTWLRRAVYNYTRQMHRSVMKTPCAVMHVRRSDVVLHQGYTRRYHAIREYMDAAEKRLQDKLPKNILLLTDDQNAIDEAEAQYPTYNWMYWDRPRFRGAEGGYESQMPSNDPMHEMLVMLSTFELVEHCNALMHSSSGFSDIIFNYMKEGTKRIDIDEGLEHEQIFNDQHMMVENCTRLAAQGQCYLNPTGYMETYCAKECADQNRVRG